MVIELKHSLVQQENGFDRWAGLYSPYTGG